MKKIKILFSGLIIILIISPGCVKKVCYICEKDGYWLTFCTDGKLSHGSGSSIEIQRHESQTEQELIEWTHRQKEYDYKCKKCDGEYPCP